MALHPVPGPAPGADGGEAMRVYRRTANDQVEYADEPFYPFFFLSDVKLLTGFPRGRFRLQRLQGEGFFQYLVVFESRDADRGRHSACRAAGGHGEAAAGRGLHHRPARAAVPDADRAHALPRHGRRRAAPAPARHRGGGRRGLSRRRPARAWRHHRRAERQPGLEPARPRAAPDRKGGARRDAAPRRRARPRRDRRPQHFQLRSDLPARPLPDAPRPVCARARRLGAALFPRQHPLCRADDRLRGVRDRRPPRHRHAVSGDGVRRVQARPAQLHAQGRCQVLRLRARGPHVRPRRRDRARLARGPGAAAGLRAGRRDGDRAPR